MKEQTKSRILGGIGGGILIFAMRSMFRDDISYLLTLLLFALAIGLIYLSYRTNETAEAKTGAYTTDKRFCVSCGRARDGTPGNAFCPHCGNRFM
jgi:ribosomal protein S27AE